MGGDEVGEAVGWGVGGPPAGSELALQRWNDDCPRGKKKKRWIVQLVVLRQLAFHIKNK